MQTCTHALASNQQMLSKLYITLSYECVVKNLKNILKSYVNIIVRANKQ